MQCLFILTTRMHERYQVVVLPFALMAYLVHKKPRFLALFCALSVMTALNQAFVLLPINAWMPWGQNPVYDNVLSVLSVVNVLVFIWSAYICVRFFVTKKQEDTAYGVC